MTNVIKISHKLFNPNYYHLRDAMANENIRFIYLIGGSSSAKSHSVAQSIILDTLQSGDNTIVLRKVGSSIKNSIYEDFKQIINNLNLTGCFRCYQNIIRCYNGAKIDFSGLDDSEKIKGISNYKRVILEELTEFELYDQKQIRKRLRGRKGQQIISMFNPISEKHWIKTEVFDKENLTEAPNHLYPNVKDVFSGKVLNEEYTRVAAKWVNSERTVYNPRTQSYDRHPADTVIIKSTYLNNFWVVGSPDGTYGYYDRQTIADFEKDKERDYDYYRIYALGEWGSIKTGGEFWYAFDPSKHKGKIEYNNNLPVHVTIDNNVLPYISIAIWQSYYKDGVYHDVQIYEIAAREPFNSVTKAAELTAKYLLDIGHTDKVFLYGDQTTKASNTIDDEKRSFFDKFREKIEESFVVEERIPNKNPSVSMSGEFVNAIYAGAINNIKISINEKCLESIDDYILTKKDINGGILKKRIKNRLTGQTYEEHGHFSDTKRYLITQLHSDLYTKFSLRRKHNHTQEDDIMYYDKSKIEAGEYRVEINLDKNNIFSAAKYFVKDKKVYICDVLFTEGLYDTKNLAGFMADCTACEMELNPKYKWYLFELRTLVKMPVIGKKESTDFKKRISAHTDNVRTNFYFPPDYDYSEEFSRFFNNYLDYDGDKSCEAVNILCQVCESEMRKGNLRNNV
ncbi:MAG: PBSX family phage terminase large subunit [Bacteroidales bacterium]|nr:PBSX family phage terminase large subunit [Bacteroidales bacterium]